MVDDSFSSKLKKVKSRSKVTPSGRSKTLVYIVAIISIVIISFMAYNIYQMEMAKRAEMLKEAKTTAKNNIKQMFSSYPNDPNLNMYITKIENSNSIEEINKIVSDAKSYIEFRRHKDKVIDNIKNIYGKYYYESLYAQSIVNKIQKAKSVEEINRILKSSNIKEDARIYYLNSIVNSIDPDRYYIIDVSGENETWKGKEVIDYIKKLSLTDIKKFSEKIVLASFYKVAIVVPATQCGKIPLEGSRVKIYDKVTSNRKPIQGVVDSSYVIVNSINYKESKSVSNIFTEDKDISKLSSTSDIEYSLENVPGILYATAAEKLDYYKVISKFGRYGERLNKITSDTQIFDENAKYLLIVSVPSTDIPKLLSIQSTNIYIVVEE